MNATAATPINAPRVKPMEVLVVGRLEAHRRYEKLSFSRLITPAADAYSRPQVVEVRSKVKLGEIGEEITVSCKLGGFMRKPYRVTDRDTGEVTTITPVDLTLDAVE